MIPRTIHYCWFGDKEKPAEVLRMIANWQKHCPGYEIKGGTKITSTSV